MSGGIEVDPEQVALCARTMEGEADKIHATMQRLMADLGSLPGAWKGNAANAFILASNAWEQKAQVHRTKLNAVAATLQVTSKNQGALEDVNEEESKKLLSAIQAGLGGHS